MSISNKIIEDLLEELNQKIKAYQKAKRQIEIEKENYLLQMEYTPLPENNVLQKVVHDRKARVRQSVEHAAFCVIHNGTVPKKAEAEVLKQTEAYQEAYRDLLAERPEFQYLSGVQYPQDLKPADYAIYQGIILEGSTLPSMIESRKILADAKLICKELIPELALKDIIKQQRKPISAAIEAEVEDYFRTQKLGDVKRITAKSMASIFQRYLGHGDSLRMNSLRRICFPSVSTTEYLLSMVNSSMDADVSRALQTLQKAQQLMGIDTTSLLRQHLGGNRFADAFLKRVCSQFSQNRVASLITQNPNYASMIRSFWESEQRSAMITQGLLDAIPDTYPELFPLAREMQRHFVLHIGPTNSGKSYEALEALKQADTGVYLAPLRLLAYEKYEEMNLDGVWCSLKTGEEEILVPGATIRSSTIEVLDFTKSYDVAVIDEGQMLADPQRGSAWTMALLGVQAEVIHVCAAPEAEQVLIEIIEACDDTYEIVRHERLVPLYCEEYAKPIFPKRAQRGDAFIVFSRRDVHAAASELQKQGHKCSIIYGNLPYDVRRGEVNRYVNGETDVVVATDAIGMGLNLPIQRIVFLELSKFDGEKNRQLLPAEMKQIAGRAGRYGIFAEGIVTSDVDFPYMEEALKAPPIPIEHARIGFPYSLLGVEGRVSELMDRWSSIKPKPGFEMTDMSREISLARMLEAETTDKELVYQFVMFPFDEKNDKLRDIWFTLFLGEKDGKPDFMQYLPEKPSRKMENLQELEEAFKICDLLYHYADTFTDRSDSPEILSRKSQISSAIMAILSRQKLESRVCRSCGKPLPFHYAYGICQDCFRKQSPPAKAPQSHGRRRRSRS